MCGILGIHNSKTTVTRDMLKRGADTLFHRGPDGEGFWIADKGKTGLAHRRLSIIDLATGAQPLPNETGDVIAVVNGEFYDHETIRTELASRGHVFKTRSDSEILLHLYEEYGADCLPHLRGEFAFILFDARRNRLFAARDRFGIKPLCYTVRPDGTLLLASEAKALFAMGAPAAWDHDSFHTAAAMQYTLPGRTLFRDILQLQPGYMLLAENGGVKTARYWDMDFLPEAETRRDEAAATEEIAGKLCEAVRLRLAADVPVCFHLSGGLDSSAILGLAAQAASKPLDAFTVRFDHEGYDEFSIAAETAAHLGARLHPVHVTQDDLVHGMADAVYHGEGLAINGHLAAKYLLNKAIRAAGFKVALSGEGSDEIFAGYPHMRQDLLRFDTANDAAINAQQALYATNMASAGVQLAHGAGLSTAAVTAALGHTPAFLEAKATLGLRMTALLRGDYLAAQAHKDAYADFIAASDKEQLTGRHPVNQAAWLWSKTALAGYILRTLGDGMEMAQSVEGRLPFLDHRLFEAVRRLPVGMKIKNGVEKHILREAVKPVLTDTVYKRQKHPFMAPPVSVFAHDGLMSSIADTVRSQSFKSMPFFDAEKAKSMLQALPRMTARDRTAAEPVLMMMLTSHILQQRFGLAA